MRIIRNKISSEIAQMNPEQMIAYFKQSPLHKAID